MERTHLSGWPEGLSDGGGKGAAPSPAEPAAHPPCPAPAPRRLLTPSWGEARFSQTTGVTADEF